MRQHDIGTVFLYNIDTLHNIFLTVHGTSTLADIFDRLGLMEREGSGIKKIKK